MRYKSLNTSPMKKLFLKTCIKSTFTIAFALVCTSFIQVIAQATPQFDPSENEPTNMPATVSAADEEYSLKFDGSANVTINNYGGYAGAIDYTSFVTISFWMKVDDLSGRHPVFSTGPENEDGAFQIEVGTGSGGTGRISVYGNDTWMYESKDHVITTGNWIHVTYMRNGPTSVEQWVYINGSLITPNNLRDYTIKNNNNSYLLGSNYDSKYFKGSIFNLTVWETTFTTKQVEASLNSAPDLSNSNLAAYFPIDEGTDDFIYDKSSNENYGETDKTEWVSDGPGSFVAGVGGIDLSSVDESTPSSTIYSNVNFKGLSLRPIAPDALVLNYNASENEYSIYGTVQIPGLGDEDIKATLGTADNPGLIIKDGAVTQITLGITENFNLKGIEIETNDLGMEWKEDGDKNVFHVYGDANLFIDNVELDTDFGTVDKPGIIMEGNHLQKLDVLINSDIDMGNIDLKAKDLRFDYEASSDEIFVTGEGIIKEVFEVKIDLGSGDKKGLVVDLSTHTPKFKVEDFSVEVDHLDLGTIDIKKLKLAFNENGITESDLSVIISGSDEIGGSMKFTGNPATISSIDIYYRADNLEEAIELFEGVQLAYVDGKVTNIENPSDLKVEAIVQAFAGGGMTFDNTSVTLIEAGADLTVDKTGFDLKEELNFGTYRLSGNSWTTLLGHLEAHFKVDFPTQTASASFDNQLPGSEPFIEIIEAFSISPTNLSMWVEVRFFVPNNIPVIHGKTLGSVDGVFHYWFNNPSGGYMAAWADIGVWKLKATTGGRINFHDTSIDIIGSGTVANIKKYNPKPKLGSSQAQGYTNSIHNFEVSDPNPPNFVLIDARWHQEIDTVLVTVMGPEGFYETNRLVILNQNDETTMPDFGYEENMDVVVNDTSAFFMISTPAMDNEKEGIRPSMVNGRYNVVLSYPGSVPDSSTVKTYQHWQKPTVEMGVIENEQNNYDIDISYWSARPDSVSLMVFASDTASTSDGKLIANLFPEDLESGNSGSYSMEYSPDFIPLDDSLYFYVVLNDGANVPQKSSITDPHHHKHDINGSITFPAESDSLSSGLRVFLDEDGDGSWDIESTGGREHFAITHPDGAFDLLNIEKGTYNLSVVLPKGYRIKGTEDRFGSVEVTFDGSPVTANLEIETYTEN